MTNKTFDHFVHELEDQFHTLQDKLTKARDDYMLRHQKDFDSAKKQVQKLSKKLQAEKKRYGATLTSAKESGGKKASTQLKKAKAAVSVMASSLTEAKDIMLTAEDKLKSAKPFDRKLAARQKALQEFEKQWEKKMKAEAAAKAKRATERKKLAAAKKKAAAKTTSKSRQNQNPSSAYAENSTPIEKQYTSPQSESYSENKQGNPVAHAD